MVLEHTRYPSGIYKMVLKAPEIARRCVAGHFVEVRCLPVGVPAGFDPLLRRPFSVSQIRREEGTVSFIYRVVGRGTSALSAVAPGQKLDVLGPLGRSFPDPKEGSGTLVLVGGGLGIPPMIAAAERALAAGRKTVAIIGARTRDFLAGRVDLELTGMPLTIVTDDGSAGMKGLVTDPLKQALATGEVGEVWACGPEGMLQAVKTACPSHVPCYVSVERHMACGFGVCIGCTVPKADGPGFLKACQDGPVFPAQEVILGEY